MNLEIESHVWALFSVSLQSSWETASRGLQNALKTRAPGRQQQSPPVMSSARNFNKPRIFKAPQPRVSDARVIHNLGRALVRVSNYRFTDSACRVEKAMFHFFLPRILFFTGRFIEDAAHVNSVNVDMLFHTEALASEEVRRSGLVTVLPGSARDSSLSPFHPA